MKKVTSTLKRGFTLIELLVVIAIIGILSSIVLASLSSARQKAKNAAYLAELKQLITALKLYREDEGHYPIVDFGTSYDSQDGLYNGGLNNTLANYMPVLPYSEDFNTFIVFNDQQSAGWGFACGYNSLSNKQLEVDDKGIDGIIYTASGVKIPEMEYGYNQICDSNSCVWMNFGTSCISF